MAAFKEGDWVRALVGDEVVGVGDVGRVAKSDRTVTHVDWVGKKRWAYINYEMEPWTPKVGERVRMTRAVDGLMAECGAAVVHDDKKQPSQFLIEFDEPQAMAHSGGGKAKQDHGWWVDAADLEPLPVAAEAQPAAPAPLTIQAGKFYKTRDGRKVGPVARNGDRRGHWYWRAPRLESYEPYWCKNGDFYEGSRWHKNDLIAEWPSDTPTTNVAATVDALDEEYGPGVREVRVEKPKFKVGDRVRGYAPAFGNRCGEIVSFYNSSRTQMYMIKDENSGFTMWIDNDTVELAEEPERTMIRTRNGYGFELARAGAYVWVDIGQKAPITVRADSIKAA